MWLNATMPDIVEAPVEDLEELKGFEEVIVELSGKVILTKLHRFSVSIRVLSAANIEHESRLLSHDRLLLGRIFSTLCCSYCTMFQFSFRCKSCYEPCSKSSFST